MVEYRIDCDAEFYQTAFDRYRKQHWFTCLSRPVRFVGIAVFGLMAIGTAIAQLWGPAIGSLLCLLFVLYVRGYEWKYRLKQLRKSPHFGHECVTRIEDQGLLSESSISSSALCWEVFTKATIFEDGLLLFQGPGYFHWLPNSSLVAGTSNEARSLVQNHVKVVKTA